MKNEFRLLQLLTLSFACSACAMSECDHFASIVDDAETVRIIELWADQSVFNKEFRADDFREAYGGPGLKVFKEASGVSPPKSVPGHLGVMGPVRTLGPTEATPNAIFLGSRNYAGVIVFRNSIEGDRESVGLSKAPFRVTNGRVAAVCREDLEDRRAQ